MALDFFSAFNEMITIFPFEYSNSMNHIGWYYVITFILGMNHTWSKIFKLLNIIEFDFTKYGLGFCSLYSNRILLCISLCLNVLLTSVLRKFQCQCINWQAFPSLEFCRRDSVKILLSLPWMIIDRIHQWSYLGLKFFSWTFFKIEF
jgi:hypothetical protein